MIRSIANTPAPVPTTSNPTPTPAEPKPAPAPTEGEGKNLAFKGIAVKNFPNKAKCLDFMDFLQSGNPSLPLIGSNKRVNADVMSLNLRNSKYQGVLMGKDKAAEEVIYKNLMAKKAEYPSVEIHKIDDWA